MRKSEKGANSISAYQEISISENQEIYPHYFAKRNKAWGQENEKQSQLADRGSEILNTNI